MLLRILVKDSVTRRGYAPVLPREALHSRESFDAYELLHAGIALVLLMSGVDQMLPLTAGPERRPQPEIPAKLEPSPRLSLRWIATIEIALGAGVALKPKVYSRPASIWFLGSGGRQILARKHLGMAIRDLGLALGAAALGRLSQKHDQGRVQDKIRWAQAVIENRGFEAPDQRRLA